jgi:6-pyruvoyltetrahydropterin/6-carboxytetrahydropterin synthase
MLVTKKIEIDMGHRVPNHASKCCNPHGHRYVIECGVDDKVISTTGSSSEGMVIDFGDLKKIMVEHIDSVYDHSYTIYNKDPYMSLFDVMKKDNKKINVVPFVPTAENLAQHWFIILDKELKKAKLLITLEFGKHQQVQQYFQKMII